MPWPPTACGDPFRRELGSDLSLTHPLGLQGLYASHRGVRIVGTCGVVRRPCLTTCRTRCLTLSDSGRRRFQGCQSLDYGLHLRTNVRQNV
jgi:hypothetical protein